MGKNSESVEYVDECVEAFGRRLKMLREKANMSQTDLANALEVSRGAISFYENGDRVANIDFLHRAAAFFDVSFNYLLGCDESLHPISQDDVSFLSDDAVAALKEHADDAEILNLLITNDDIQKLIGIFYDLLDCERFRLQQAGIYPIVTGRSVEEDMKRAFSFDRRYAIFNITTALVSTLESIAVSYIYRSISDKELEAINKKYEKVMEECEESRREGIEIAQRYSEEYKKTIGYQARKAVHEWDEGD